VYIAPLTIRGPSVSRGASWDCFGVSNAGSGGSLDVNVFDLGMVASVLYATAGAGVNCEAIW
jgi:hypothetical protein